MKVTFYSSHLHKYKSNPSVQESFGQLSALTWLEIYQTMSYRHLLHGKYGKASKRFAPSSCPYHQIWLPISICLDLRISITMFGSRSSYVLVQILLIRGYSLICSIVHKSSQNLPYLFNFGRHFFPQYESVDYLLLVYTVWTWHCILFWSCCFSFEATGS